MASKTTWLVMLRDVSKAVRVKGEKHLTACMVLEMETGDMLATQIGRTDIEAIDMAIEGAALDPAGPRTHRRPDRILFGPEAAPKIAWRINQHADRLGLAQAKLIEAAEVPEAEDVFDSFIGHMAGRAQPNEFASAQDWRMLFDLAHDFLEAKPWERWADNVDLRLNLTVGRERATFAAVVLGNEGIQRGLVMYPGQEPPAGLRDWREGTKPPMPDGTLNFYLDPPSEPPAEFVAKARRYGWPPEAAFIPLFMRVNGDGSQDVGWQEVVHLALGISAVLEVDGRGPVAADRNKPSAGRLQLPSGEVATFEVDQAPPEQPQPGTLNLRMHQVGFDLVPEGSPVSMRSMPAAVLPELRRRARIHRPPPSAPPNKADVIPILAIHPRKASGDAIASRIAHDDPFGVTFVDDGHSTMAVLTCDEAAHALVDVPSDGAALALYQGRLRAATGFHVLLVADEATSKTEGNVYGMFECVMPVEPPARMNPPLRRSPSKPRGEGRRRR